MWFARMVEGTYKRWSQSGIDCYERTGSDINNPPDCRRCDIFHHFGRSHGDGCFQVDANRQLLELYGPPGFEGEKPKIEYGITAKHRRDMENQGITLKLRIVELLDEQVSKGMKIGFIVDALERERFMGYHWNLEAIRMHLVKMMEKGAIDKVKIGREYFVTLLKSPEECAYILPANRKNWVGQTHAWRSSALDKQLAQVN